MANISTNAPIVMTTCTTAHCYEKCEATNDPAKPPFCSKCKAKRSTNRGY